MLKVLAFLALVAAAAPFPTASTVDGVIDLTGSWRVVGGSGAANGEYPFIASIRTAHLAHFCGGSIINDEWVLTAAHCLIGQTIANTAVVVGTNTLVEGGEAYPSSRLLVHASYDPSTVANDIAVIKLASPLTYNDLVVPVTLNTEYIDVTEAILIGWGRIFTDGPVPNNLQDLAINTIPLDVCRSLWGNFVTERQVCAVTNFGEGACNGDSGGPLIRRDNRAQIGIVSFRHVSGCAQGWPDVYARVSSYLAWINVALASKN